MKSFTDGLKTSIDGVVSTIQSADYLSWATAIALADRPQIDVVMFDGKPYLELFDTAVVAVSCHGQYTWLPILDNRNKPIPYLSLTSRDISDSINRARAKSVAMVCGVGMALYAGYGSKWRKFLCDLRVTPDTDLATIEPSITTVKGKSAYVDWASALTSVKIVDPTFTWEVEMHKVVNHETGEIETLPVMRLGLGWAVSVTTIFKGQRHTEFLPIMGQGEVQTKNGLKKMDHQPLTNPNAFDWNRAVMRCLAKAIAVVSGYGLSVYAGEDLEALQRQPAGRSAPAQQQQPEQQPEQEPEQEQEQEQEHHEADPEQEEKQERMNALTYLINKTSTVEQRFLSWIGLDSIASVAANDEKFARAIEALEAKLKTANAA